MIVRGIDVSAAQGTPPDSQWQAIASDKRFVYAEAQIGNDGPSSTYVAQIAGARAAGLVVGAYLFAYPLPDAAGHAGRDPEAQAQALFEACGGLGSSSGELPPVIDLEWPAGTEWARWGCSAPQIVDWTVRCAAKLRALFGVAPVVYSYPFFLRSLGDVGAIGDLRLWLASYQVAPDVPAPWTTCTIQQTGGGTYRLPSGAPCDEDAVADDATFQALLVRP
jgi:GH25 family lysozyme M1 (1,4-beta-N-acetylmuramidase)